MDTIQLERLLSDHLGVGVHYGVCAFDELPLTSKRPLALVINLSPSGTSGTHWIAIWFSSDGHAEHFDSFGSKPIAPIEVYLDTHTSSWNYNTRLVQSLVSTLCGGYCVMFLEGRQQNKFTDLGILLRKLFPFEDPLRNDRIVQARMLQHYNTNIPIIDTTLWRVPGLGRQHKMPSVYYWTQFPFQNKSIKSRNLSQVSYNDSYPTAKSQ